MPIEKNAEDRTPLLLATCHGYNKLVKLLLENGADVEYSSYRRTEMTVLHLAAKNGHPKVAYYLIFKGGFTLSKP